MVKTKYTVALSMLVGAALGAAAVTGLNAQGKAPGAYTVFAVTDLDGDPATYKAKVADVVGPIVNKFGGTILIATNQVTTLREPALRRFAIMAWDNVEQANAWYASDEMKTPRSYFDPHTKGPSWLAAVPAPAK